MDFYFFNILHAKKPQILNFLHSRFGAFKIFIFVFIFIFMISLKLNFGFHFGGLVEIECCLDGLGVMYSL
jgi:hypothetical protein